METIEPKCYFGTLDGRHQVPVYNDIDDVKFPGDAKNYRTTPIKSTRFVKEGCMCEGPCEPETCFCALQNAVPFHSDGRIKNIGKIHNHTLDSEKSFCECHEDCPCNGVCALSLTTRHLLEEEDGGIKRPSMEIVRTPFLGWSLRAAQFIPRGTYVATLVGEMRSYKQYKDEKKNKKNAGLRCTFRDSVFINYQLDMSRFFNESRFVNHSCLPNLTQVAIRRWTEEAKFPIIGLVSLRDVEYGEPLTMDYGNMWLAESVRLNRKFACFCGERCCVLPPSRQPGDVAASLADLKAEFQAKLDQLRAKRIEIYGDTLSTSSAEADEPESDEEEDMEPASDDDEMDYGAAAAAAPAFGNVRSAGTILDRDVETPCSMDSDMENRPPRLY